MLREAKDVEGLLKVKQQRATEPHGKPTCKDGVQGKKNKCLPKEAAEQPVLGKSVVRNEK